MLGRIGRDASSPLAIEIASDSIRILQLSRRAGRCRVSAWAVEPLAGGHDTRAIEGTLESLQTPLRRALQRCRGRSRRAVLALSAAHVICRVQQMPAPLDDAALEQQLLVDSEKIFPFPLDDLALDFQVLGPAAAPGQVEVLVAACRQSLVDPLEQLCTSVGLQLVGLEVDSVALRRAVSALPGQASALLQIEAAGVVLHGFDGRIPVQQHLGHFSPVADEAWLAVLERMCSGHGRPDRIEQLLITGALADERCARKMAQRLGIPCTLLAPLDRLDLQRTVDAEGLKAVAGCMVLPCCLALGGLR